MHCLAVQTLTPTVYRVSGVCFLKKVLIVLIAQDTINEQWKWDKAFLWPRAWLLQFPMMNIFPNIMRFFLCWSLNGSNMKSRTMTYKYTGFRLKMRPVQPTGKNYGFELSSAGPFPLRVLVFSLFSHFGVKKWIYYFKSWSDDQYTKIEFWDL